MWDLWVTLKWDNWIFEKRFFFVCSGSKERQDGNSFVPEDPEAWYFRGGILGEMEVNIDCQGVATLIVSA